MLNYQKVHIASAFFPQINFMSPSIFPDVLMCCRLFGWFDYFFSMQDRGVHSRLDTRFGSIGGGSFHPKRKGCSMERKSTVRNDALAKENRGFAM
jgi:hypothetical protein